MDLASKPVSAPDYQIANRFRSPKFNWIGNSWERRPDDMVSRTGI